MSVFWDIETDGVGKDGTPINVTCAATLFVSDMGHTRVPILWHSNYQSFMTTPDIERMVDYLYTVHCLGVNIVTFNGLGFDWRVVFNLLKGKNPERDERIKVMAQQHIDIFFIHTVNTGYWTSLASYCDGCNIQGKTLASGKDAIDMWLGPHSTKESKDHVLKYCLNDTRCLADLYFHIKTNREAHRIAKSGRRSVVAFPTLWTVQQCIEQYENHPPKASSWMENPPDVMEPTQWLVR